jgi:myo-inositol-1(or 4)-monophosphatase
LQETDLALLIDAARAAGEIATGFSGPTARSWDKPDGAGPVTEADLAVNDMLCDRLQAARPSYGWLSEETEDTVDRLDSDTVFIVDPIDGTRSFAEGSNTWAHALAVAHKGIVTAAVVYLPLRDLMFSAASGQGAFLNGALISPSDRDELTGAEMLATRPNMDPKFWAGDVPDFNQSHRPSLAYRMALVAQGKFDGMLTFRPSWEWDIAAGDLILREAGARVTDKAGLPLRFNNPHPTQNGVVAGGALLHAQVITLLQTD